MKKLLITIGLALVASVLPALSGCSQEGRYQLVSADTNVYRLDTVTGQVWEFKGGNVLGGGGFRLIKEPIIQ
jgi:hypothetical protein